MKKIIFISFLLFLVGCNQNIKAYKNEVSIFNKLIENNLSSLETLNKDNNELIKLVQNTYEIEEKIYKDKKITKIEIDKFKKNNVKLREYLEGNQ